MSTLWIYFILFAALSVFTLLYAFRSLGPAEDAEKRVMELQDRDDSEQ
ncbi:MAG: hypothetical protein ACE5F6_18510 [Anaerolineae bacterium]